MRRKWTTLAVAAAASALFLGGFSVADDEPKSKLHLLMEKVNKSSLTITKGVRTSIAYAKAKKDLEENAKDLVKLGKEAREMKDAAEAQKKPYEEWTKLCDDYIKAAEEFSGILAKSSTDQAAAKTAYRDVAKTCTGCHEVFRVEDDF